MENAAIEIEYVEYAQERGKRFIVMYGQTEDVLRMSYLPFKSALDKYFSIGIPVSDGKFCIRDT